MKKVLATDYSEVILLLDKSEVEEKVYIDESTIVFLVGNNAHDIKEFEEKYKVELEEYEEDRDYTILEKILEEYTGSCEMAADGYINTDDDQWIYSMYDRDFGKLSDFEHHDCYTYLDSGSNWKTIEFENIEEVEVLGSVCLDENYNGNYQTGGTGLHQYVYIIKDESDIIRFLIEEQTQWQGRLDSIIEDFTDIDDVREHIEELGNDRDVDEYIESIESYLPKAEV